MTDTRKELLFEALDTEDMDTFLFLLRKFESFTQEDKDFCLYRTILRAKDFSFVKKILDLYGSLDYADDKKRTLIHYAVSGFLIETVEFLLKNGFTLEDRSQAGSTPLLTAACNTENPQMIYYLVDQGADIEAVDEEKCTLGIEAAKNPCLKVVKACFDCGGRLEDKDSDGWTPLMNAVRYNENMDVVDFLRNLGADYLEKTSEKTNLLHLAALNTYKGMGDYISHYFYTYEADDAGITPMELVLRHNPNPEVLEVFMDSQKKENVFVVCKNPSEAVIEKFFTTYANINDQTGDFSYPLHQIARQNDNLDVLKLALYGLEAVPSVLDLYGKNILHYAAMNENKDLYHWLVEQEEYAFLQNQKDENGKKPDFYLAHPEEF